MQECGSCVACCIAFPVIELDKPEWTTCKHINNGCEIYNKRPESCKKCMCAWLQMENVGKELRPDKCGVIFERDKDKMVGTIIDNVTAYAKRQMNFFMKEGFRVVLRKEK